MKRAYDAAIEGHYSRVAKNEGHSPTSTMADETTRAIETSAILEFVSDVVRRHKSAGRSEKPLRLCDVGCGNGYTLERISAEFPDIACSGLELSDPLRQIASDRLNQVKSVEVARGDVRDADFAGGRSFDAIVCQRVLINLLDRADQKVALRNIIGALAPGGSVLFIEAFEAELGLLNKARAEFELGPIPPAEHNLYLPDDFFDEPELSVYRSDGFKVPTNVLSTHYFITRVLLPAMLGSGRFIRNSEFAKFFSAALPTGIGNYSQLKVCAFQKVSR